MFNENDFNFVVSEIMTGAKMGSDGSFSVVQKLREQLERSSTEIFPFFEACSSEIRNNTAKNEASSARASGGFGKDTGGGGVTLLVDGFPYDLSVDDIRNFLRKKVPNALNVLVPHDLVSKSTKGMAFVELGSHANVKSVIKKLWKLKMGDRSLRIIEYKPKNGGRPSGGTRGGFDGRDSCASFRNRNSGGGFGGDNSVAGVIGGGRSDNNQRDRGFGERRRGFGVRGRGYALNFGGSIIRRQPRYILQ